MGTQIPKQLDSEDSKEQETSVKASFDKTVQWINNFLAPLLLLNYIIQVQKIVEYIFEYPCVASFFILIFASLFLYNIFRHVKFRSPKKADYKVIDRTVFKERIRRKKFMVCGGVLASLIAFILIITTYILVFVTGVYYVAIASAPDRERAVQEAASINKILDQRGLKDLRAKAYASTATGNHWYTITVGGFHFSREEAQKTLRRTLEALGGRMRDDAFVYSTASASPTRTIGVYFKKLFKQ